LLSIILFVQYQDLMNASILII